MPIGIAVHVLAAIVWLGGLVMPAFFFRPGAGVHEAAEWRPAPARFFVWAWLAVPALFASGAAMVFIDFGGFAALPTYVRLMMIFGVIAAALFAYTHAVPWRGFRKAIFVGDATAAAAAARQVRMFLVLVLAFGLIAAATGASGRY